MASSIRRTFGLAACVGLGLFSAACATTTIAAGTCPDRVEQQAPAPAPPRARAIDPNDRVICTSVTLTGLFGGHICTFNEIRTGSATVNNGTTMDMHINLNVTNFPHGMGTVTITRVTVIDGATGIEVDALLTGPASPVGGLQHAPTAGVNGGAATESAVGSQLSLWGGAPVPASGDVVVEYTITCARGHSVSRRFVFSF